MGEFLGHSFETITLRRLGENDESHFLEGGVISSIHHLTIAYKTQVSVKNVTF